jgi:cytoskeleton protein RodZ
MSTVTAVMTDQAVAVKAGADLRAARERLGWSIEVVAEELRIRRVHLEALEDGRLATLPGHAYAMAFVRTYARALGLDPDETVRRFKTEAGEVSAKPALVFPAPVPERGLPSGAVVLLGIVLAVGAYVGWYRLSAEGRLPAETVIPVPERLAPLAEQAIPPAAPPAVVADAGANGALKIVPGTPAQGTGAPAQMASNEPPAPPPPSISPTSAAAASVQQPPHDVAPPPALAPSIVAPAGPDDSRIVLRANALSWLMVKDKTGAILLNKTLKPGDTWPVPPRTDLLLTTGNAGGTDILLDGTQTASIGGNGVVRRDLPLDPDQIRDGKLAANTTPQVASTRAHQ